MAVITQNGFFGTPPIVTDGLVLNLDSFNTKSIPVDPTENLLKWSEQFDQSTWLKTSGSVSANTFTAPDGTSTADSFIETSDGVAGLHYMDNASFTQVPNNNYTFSLYVSKASTRNIGISIGSSRLYASYNLATGTVGVVNSNGTDFVSHSAAITSIDSNWYRVSLSGYSLTTGGGYCRVILDATAGGTGGNGATYVGNGTSGSYIWGAQLDMSRYATPYIQSTATTGKRNVWYDLSGRNINGTLLSGSTGTIPRYSKLNEGILNFGFGSSCTFPASTFNSGSPQQGTISMKVKFPILSTTSTTVMFNDGGGSSNLIYFYRNAGDGTDQYQWLIYSNAGAVLLNSTFLPEVWYDTTFTFDSLGNYRTYKNGKLDKSVTVTGFTSWNRTGTNPPRITATSDSGSGNIAQFLWYDRALSEAEVLQNYNAMKTRFNII
jgi:hypothetical protein